jgi:hypothetical protein
VSVEEEGNIEVGPHPGCVESYKLRAINRGYYFKLFTLVGAGLMWPPSLRILRGARAGETG